MRKSKFIIKYKYINYKNNKLIRKMPIQQQNARSRRNEKPRASVWLPLWLVVGTWVAYKNTLAHTYIHISTHAYIHTHAHICCWYFLINVHMLCLLLFLFYCLCFCRQQYTAAVASAAPTAAAATSSTASDCLQSCLCCQRLWTQLQT